MSGLSSLDRTTEQKKAEILEFMPEEHLQASLVFLDELRESGDTNMFGASPYVVEWFSDEYNVTLTSRQASSVVGYWMATFSARHGKA